MNTSPYRIDERPNCNVHGHVAVDGTVNGYGGEYIESCVMCGMIRVETLRGGWSDWFDPRPTPIPNCT